MIYAHPINCPKTFNPACIRPKMQVFICNVSVRISTEAWTAGFVRSVLERNLVISHFSVKFDVIKYA